MRESARCSNCGADRTSVLRIPPNFRHGCGVCGSPDVTVSVELSEDVRTAARQPLETVSKSTAAAQRLQTLQSAVDTLAHPFVRPTLEQAVTHVMTALEAIHQFQDARRFRHEWSFRGWSEAELELWHAHLGARNGATHGAWTPVTLRTAGLMAGAHWAPQISGIRSEVQRAAYRSRLEDRPAFASLDTICQLIRRSVG